MLPEDTPTVVVLHGLTGGLLADHACCPHTVELMHVSLLQGSHESYVRAILAPACTPVSDGGLGYRAVVVNFRGCKFRYLCH
jgi:uncharacterized protein